MGLERESVDSPGVDGLNGGQFLLVLFHKIGQLEQQRSAISSAHFAPFAVVECVFCSVYRLKMEIKIQWGYEYRTRMSGIQMNVDQNVWISNCILICIFLMLPPATVVLLSY